MASDFGNLDEITSDARANLVGQTGATTGATSSGLGAAGLGVGLSTSAAQGLLGWYTWRKEQEQRAKEMEMRRQEFARQMALQERGQDFRESSYRSESPTRTAQGASGLNSVAGQNLKYLELMRGIRGVGV